MKGLRIKLIAVAALAAMFFVAAVANAAPSEGAVAPVPASTLSATGTGQVLVAAASQGTILNVGIHDQVNGSPEVAIKSVQAKMDAIRRALEKAGVPLTSIQIQNFNIYPIYGPMPMPEPVKGEPMPPVPGTPPITGYNVDQNLQAETTSLEQLTRAMQAAIDAGATSVNTYLKGGGPEGTMPDAAALSQAVREATAQAKALAEASADAAGVKVGSIANINVQPPNPWYGPVPSWRVSVTITYNIVQ